MRGKKCFLIWLSCLLLIVQPFTAFANAVGDGSGSANTGGSVSGSSAGANNDTTRDFRVGSVVFLADFGKFFHTTGDIELDRADSWAPTRTYNSAAIAPRIKETGRFYVGVKADVLWYNAALGCYDLIPADRVDTPIQAIDGQTIMMDSQAGPLSSGEPWATRAVQVFGDAGGKLTDLVNAIAALQPEIREKISKKKDSADVNVDASIPATEQVPVALSYDEINTQLEHYLDWWTAVYNDLGAVEPGVKTPEELKTEFNKIVEESHMVAQAYSDSGVGSAGSSVHWEYFKNYQYFTEDMLKYPALGIDYLVYRRHTGDALYRCMNWEAIRQHAEQEIGGASNTFAHGWGLHGNRLYGSNGFGQQCMRSPSLMFTNSVIYGKNNFINAGQPANGKDANSGYQFFGYYGALPFGSVTVTFVDDPEVPPPPVEIIPEDTAADDVGTYYLMDYEMNHVFDSMAEHYEDSTSHDHARLNSGIWTTDPSIIHTAACGEGHNYDTEQFYSISYAEDDGSGRSVAMDNAGPTKLFLHNNGVKGNTWWTRDQIRAGQTVDSNSVGDYVIDYGFNLLRKHFDDARGYSKIIAQDVSKEYLEQTLGMYEAIITNNPASASGLRDSKATVGPVTGIKDNLGWSAKYEKTSLTSRYYTESESHTYYCDDDDCSGETCNYHTSHSDGGIKAFSVHGDTPTTYNVRLVSIAHKYQTADIPTGYAAPKDMVPFDYRPTTDGDGSDDDNQYRGINTIDPGVTVEYVPEVPMLIDEVPGPELEHHPKKVTTVGEKSRKSKLILMTLYRMTGASTPVTGVVYSDTAVGGDAGRKSQSEGNLALTAGGDFTIKADTNMQINLYGYALDLIEPGDAGYDTVTLGNDVKAGWGNSGSRAQLMETYQKWAAAMLNPRNYQADFEMTIGSKKYNSFSATIGSFSSKASQSSETGQYNIHVKHGRVQEDDGYQAFIAQLALDYGCSTDEAGAIFEASDMKQAIIKAIEHDNSSLNKSEPVGDTESALVFQSGGLGNATHWYDEEVRVFVIRRFMTPAARVQNVIAQDKMDIGTAMSSLGGDALGRFNLNVWFRSSCYTRAVEEYYPGTSGDNKNSAIVAGDLIVAGVRVNGADFNITNATTATGRH